MDTQPDVDSELDHVRSHSPSFETMALALARLAGWDVLFAGFLLGIWILRWQIVSSSPIPPGLDGGNWLALGHTLLGSHSRSLSITYPPVVPLLSAASAAVWGPMTGTSILAVSASLAPSIGAYVLLRHLRVRAVLLAGLLAPAATTGEALAWGGYPQLIALGFFPIAIWAIDEFLTTHDLRWAWVGSLFLFLTIATSDLVGVIALGVLALFVVIRVVLSSPRPSPRTLFDAAIVVALPSLAMAPTYLALAGGSLHTEVTKTSIQHLTLGNVEVNLANLFKDDPPFWYLLLLVALLAPLALNVRRGRPLAAAVTALLGVTLAAVLAFRDVRFLYFLPLATVVGLGAWWSLLTTARNFVATNVDGVLVALSVILLVVEVSLGVSAFHEQVEWYSALNPGVASGLTQLDHIAPRDAVLGVSPAGDKAADEDGWPLGRWVEGLLDRPTYYASDLEWLNYSDERRRAVIANQMFSSSEGPSGAVAIARQHGIDYIIVDKAWPGYESWVGTHSSLDGASVILDNDSVLIIAVGQ